MLARLDLTLWTYRCSAAGQKLGRRERDHGLRHLTAHHDVAVGIGRVKNNADSPQCHLHSKHGDIGHHFEVAHVDRNLDPSEVGALRWNDLKYSRRSRRNLGILEF